jgi:WD40 repeat protein
MPLDHCDGTLSLVHFLGYGSSRLLYSGDGHVIYCYGNVVCRLPHDHSAGRKQAFTIDGLGIGVIAVHPDFKTFAHNERGSTSVWIRNFHDGQIATQLEDVSDIDVDVLAFTLDGSALVTVSGVPDFKVIIWDWAQQQIIVNGRAPVRLLSGSFNPFTPDQLCFQGEEGLLFICNVVTGADGPELEMEKVEPPAADVTFTSHAWAPSDGRLFCATSAGELWRVDPNTNKLIADPTPLAADGSPCSLLCTQDHLLAWTAAGALTWLSLASLAESYRAQLPLAAGAALVSACQGDDHLFLGASDGSIYHLRLLQRLPAAAADDDAAPATVLDPDALAGDIQFDAYHRLRRIGLFHAGPVAAVAPLPAVACVATAGADGSLLVWDAAGGALVAAQVREYNVYLYYNLRICCYNLRRDRRRRRLPAGTFFYNNTICVFYNLVPKAV